MITKFATLPLVYGKQDRENVGVTTLRGLSLGWHDCLESFEDWCILLSAPQNHADAVRGLSNFFVLLGQPLEGADEYEAPWDEFLFIQRYVAKTRAMLKEGQTHGH
ncbi:MAG: hypothetical protein ACFB2W_00895 [Leptolyngbyaceae cyanobacterium]